MTRRTVAIAVVVFWVAGLGLFARRQLTRSPREQLLEVSLRISPQTYYYVVESNGRSIGAAMSAIDTTADRVVTADFFTGQYPVGKDTLKMTARGNASYSRALLLRDFTFALEGDQGPTVISGRTHGDSILIVDTQSSGNPDGRARLRIASPAFMATMAPVVGMLGNSRDQGDTINVSIFDPISRELKLVSMKVHYDTLFRIADSAVLNRKTNSWEASATDTVRATKLGGDGAPFTVWVDLDGRIVAASEAGGISIIRSAYELAFKREKPRAAPPVMRPRP